MAGTAGNDTIEGTIKADVLRGFGGDDILVGYDANDYLVGGDGNDELYPGIHNDTASGNAGDDYIAGSMGSDFLYGGAGNDFITGGSSREVDDGFFQRSGSDYLSGYMGSDSFVATDGHDTYDGGSGRDYIGAQMTGLGHATLISVEVFVAIFDRASLNCNQVALFKHFEGSSASDAAPHLLLFGGGLADFNTRALQGVSVRASPKGNVIIGDLGDDTLSGNVGVDKLFGGSGDDQLVANHYQILQQPDEIVDRLWGGTGDDTFIAKAWGAGLYGGSGNDKFNLYVDPKIAGPMVLSGGGGFDTLYVRDYSSRNYEMPRIDCAGIEKLVVGGFGSFLLEHIFMSPDQVLLFNRITSDLKDNPVPEISISVNGIYDFRHITGNGIDLYKFLAVENEVFFGDYSDSYRVARGNSTVHCGGGDDYVACRKRGNFILGESGNDVLDYTARYSTFPGSVSFNGGDGTDAIVVSDDEFTRVKLTSVEELRSDRTLNLTLEEMLRFDSIRRHEGIGIAPEVRIINSGVAGLSGRTPDGIIVYTSADGNTLELGATADKVYTSLGTDIVHASGGNDTIQVSAGHDSYDGGFGRDVFFFEHNNQVIDCTIDGGPGNDVIRYDGFVGDFADLVIGVEILEFVQATEIKLTPDQVNAFKIIGPKSAFDYTSSISLTSSGAIDLSGRVTGGITVNASFSGNEIIGGSYSDKLHGWTGNDTLAGGAGADVLSGGTGSDKFVFRYAYESGAGARKDVVLDFEAASDILGVSAIDANSTTAGNQAFVLAGGSQSAMPGTFVQVLVSDGLLLNFNTDTDLGVEMSILLGGLTNSIELSSFIL